MPWAFFPTWPSLPDCTPAVCYTSNLKAPQPGFFSKSYLQMSYPVDGNSAYSLISRQLFPCVLHFERDRSFVLGSCTSHTAPCESVQKCDTGGTEFAQIRKCIVFTSTMRVSSLESPKPSMPGGAWAEEQCLCTVSPGHTLEKNNLHRRDPF